MKLLLFLLLAIPLFGKQSERYYQEMFAREIGGQVEVVMKDGTRCDILTPTHAIEVDFAKKWAEAIGQSLNYALHTGKRPAVALIILAPSDNKYVERVRMISAKYGLGITIYPIDGGGLLLAHLSLVQLEKRSFGLPQAGRLTSVVAGTTGRLRAGGIRINRVGIAVSFAGVDRSFQCHQRLSLLRSALKIWVLQVSHRS